MLTTSYPRFEGDYRGVFIQKLERALREQDIDVVVVEPRGYNALKRGAGLIPNLRTSTLARMEFPVYCMHFLIIALYHGLRCDLIHANWSLSGFFAVVAGKITRKRVIVTERGQFLIDARNKWINRWLHWVLSGATTRTVISESAREAMKRKFPDLSFHAVPNGVDDVVFSPALREETRSELGLDDDVVHIITVGRLTSVKRLDTLVDALAGLRSRGEFRVWIVGDGDERETIGRAVSERGLDTCVAFLGAKPPMEAARWMCAADVFVLCSKGEGGGNVILEAMAAGLAVVSTPVGWARDYITSGDNGVLFPVGDAATLGAELEALVASPDRVAALGSAARGTIDQQKLNWTGCASRYVEHYRELAV